MYAALLDQIANEHLHSLQKSHGPDCLGFCPRLAGFFSIVKVVCEDILKHARDWATLIN